MVIESIGGSVVRDGEKKVAGPFVDCLRVNKIEGAVADALLTRWREFRIPCRYSRRAGHMPYEIALLNEEILPAIVDLFCTKHTEYASMKEHIANAVKAANSSWNEILREHEFDEANEELEADRHSLRSMQADLALLGDSRHRITWLSGPLRAELMNDPAARTTFLSNMMGGVLEIDWKEVQCKYPHLTADDIGKLRNKYPDITLVDKATALAPHGGVLLQRQRWKRPKPNAALVGGVPRNVHLHNTQTPRRALIF
jgi:hypothetical protein